MAGIALTVAFALMPGAINASNIVNLSSKTGILVYNQATTNLTIPIRWQFKGYQSPPELIGQEIH